MKKKKSLLDIVSDKKKSDNFLRYVLWVGIVSSGLVLLLMLLSSGFSGDWFKAGITKKDSAPLVEDEPGLSGAVLVDKTSQVREIGPEDYVWGPRNAKLQLIIYNDFECPFSASFSETVARAKNDFREDLVVVVRHFPLESHYMAIQAAEAAECAGEQDKFWEMHNALFEEQRNGEITEETIAQKGEQLGLEQEQYLSCLTNNKYLDKIMSQKQEAKRLGVSGTPASFLNGIYYPGALPYNEFTYPDGTEAQGLRILLQEELER